MLSRRGFFGALAALVPASLLAKKRTLSSAEFSELCSRAFAYGKRGKVIGCWGSSGASFDHVIYDDLVDEAATHESRIWDAYMEKTYSPAQIKEDLYAISKSRG